MVHCFTTMQTRTAPAILLCRLGGSRTHTRDDYLQHPRCCASRTICATNRLKNQIFTIRAAANRIVGWILLMAKPFIFHLSKPPDITAQSIASSCFTTLKDPSWARIWFSSGRWIRTTDLQLRPTWRIRTFNFLFVGVCWRSFLSGWGCRATSALSRNIISKN